MNRRTFLATAAVGSAGALPLAAQNYSDYTKDPRPDVPEGTWTAGRGGRAGVHRQPGRQRSGGGGHHHPPARAAPATGHLEYAVEDGPWQRVDGGQAGLLPMSEHVLKFRLPPLPPGKVVKYRIVARSAGWVKVRQFYHGEFKAGETQMSPERSFRTLDPRRGHDHLRRVE